MGSESTFEAYRVAHFADSGGYGPRTSSLARPEMPFFDMEIALSFQHAFRALGWDTDALQKRSIFEIGTGWGNRLNQLTGFGIPAANLSGVELHDEFIQASRHFNPGILIHKASAESLEIPDSSVDMSFASMAFSAMSEDDLALSCLRELKRVSRKAVLIIDCFDPAITQSRNGVPFYRGISHRVSTAIRSQEDGWSHQLLRSFWSFSPTRWRLFHLLLRLGFPFVGYVAFRLFSTSHSHRALLLTRKAT